MKVLITIAMAVALILASCTSSPHPVATPAAPPQVKLTLAAVSADVSEASLRREAKAAETRAQGRDGASQPEFHALDADVYALQWREGDAQRELVWTDVLNQAERHPESAGLNALARAVRALQPLLQREGKRIQSGGSR